jgi:lipid-binding SYLF domain-containing protein
MKKTTLALGLTVALSAFLGGCAGTNTTASTSTSASGNPVTGTGPGAAPQDKWTKVNSGYDEALSRLYANTPGSRELVARARGVLIFPRVIAAGLVVGGQYGDGRLTVGGRTAGYYRLASGSLGWQIGAESKAMVFLFMTDDALAKFRASNGWSGGADASVSLLKLGANGGIDVNSARAPVVAFEQTNTGLMANASLQGTKITKVE